MGSISFIRQPNDFEYFAPTSLIEASRMLLARRGDAHILAGGTDLVPMWKRGQLSPKCIVNLKRIPNLNYVRLEKNTLMIGPLATIESIRRFSLIRSNYRALHMASKEMGSENIRNIATIGGNICRASPASDMTPPLIALEANLRLFGPEGERRIPLEDFFEGPGITKLRTGEILMEIEIPRQPQKQAFLKLKRVSTDLAKINISAAFNCKSKRGFRIRIAIGSVASKVIRARKTEELLEGKELSDGILEEAGEVIQQEIDPITDIRSTKDYRNEMSRILLKRVFNTALDGRVAP
jgi:CO/xanthine dehydrogenase FAD-binding subunit